MRERFSILRKWWAPWALVAVLLGTAWAVAIAMGEYLVAMILFSAAIIVVVVELWRWNILQSNRPVRFLMKLLGTLVMAAICIWGNFSINEERANKPMSHLPDLMAKLWIKSPPAPSIPFIPTLENWAAKQHIDTEVPESIPIGKTGSKLIPSKPSVKDRSLALSQKIEVWIEPKFNERTHISDPKNPDEYYRARDEYDRKTTAEFNIRFLRPVNEIVQELDRCDADTAMLKQTMKTMTRVEHFGFIATWLRSAAHNIPEGQPGCGTGEPTKGFGIQDTGLYMLSIGSDTVGFYKEQLEQGRKSVGTTTIGGLNSFKIYIRGGIFCLDATIYGGLGMPSIEVICNHVKTSPDWDTNYTDKAVEVVDQNQVPMFQMIFENETKIRVNGVFPAENNEILIDTPKGTERVKFDPDNKTPIQIPLKTIVQISDVEVS